jgi:hypothetical protein
MSTEPPYPSHLPISPPPAGAPIRPAPEPPGTLWPRVIGVLSIVLAGQSMLGLVGALIQVILALVTGQGGFGALLGRFGWGAVYALNVVGMPALSVVLMVGGFLLYRRHRLGARLHVIYAIPAILLVGILPVAYIGLLVPQMGQQAAVFAIVSTIWGATTRGIYPVFLLVWFSKANIRRQVRAWRR